MEDIQVGEFIRTKYGDIGKYVIKQNINFIETNNGYIGFDIEEDIVKHSKNIIDLIEEGDYVNGEYIIQISKTFGYLFTETTFYDEISGEEKHNFIKKEDIKSIVTKELFSSVKYEVER